jgi:poly-gamma-glutamate synthesis protein (capsule biosynthesis protein)
LTIRITAAGDLCPGDHYFSLGHGTGSRFDRGEDPFADIAQIWRESDLVLANLEGPLSPDSANTGVVESSVFRGPLDVAPILSRAGFNLLHIANNHILEHGEGAFSSTLNILTQNGIAAVGLWAKDGAQPVVRTIRGVKLGILGYSFVREKHIPDQRLYAAPTPEVAISQIQLLRQQVDHVIVSVHWGEECTALPTREVVDLARAMRDAGAKLILGHHPHWFQPVHAINGSLVAFSLGDLAFDLFWDRRRVESAVLHVDLGLEGALNYSLTPIVFTRQYRVERLPRVARRRFEDELDVNSRKVESGFTAAPEDTPREALRKLAYFLRFFWHGSTRAKTTFVVSKVRKRFSFLRQTWAR